MTDPIKFYGTIPVDVYGPALVTIKGDWYETSVVFERRLPEHAGDPRGGNWGELNRPQQPVAAGYESYTGQGVPYVDEFRAPFTDDETRLMHFVGGPFRLRVIGPGVPSLTLTIAAAPPQETVIPSQPVDPA